MSRVRWLHFTFLPFLVALSMVFAVACGDSSSPATVIPAATGAAPAATAVPVTTAAPAALSDSVRATATAAAVAPPAEATASVPSAKAGRYPETPVGFLKAPEPNPKRGGTLRFGMIIALAHFDLHQAEAINVIIQAPQFDGLIRHNPIGPAGVIIPDLAHSWDISEDGQLYTFYLRDGVRFHDGAPLTSADAKATFDRIINPPEGITSGRQPNFHAAAVTEIRTPDPLTVEFVLSEPRPAEFVLGTIGSGYNGIVRKQTLEENNFNLRRIKDYPTTGPFKFVDYRDAEFYKMEANEDYWNPELPYVDAIDVLHLAVWTPDVAAALLANRVDFAIAVEPGGWSRVNDDPELTAVKYPQMVLFALNMNVLKPPLDDVRVRRAIHLVLNRDGLVGATKDTYPAYFGAGFTFPFSEWATPIGELRQRPGYRSGADREEDIETARALLVDAGFPNGEGFPELDFLVRSIAHIDLQAAAIQNMLLNELNIKTNIRNQTAGVWFDDAQNGNFDLTATSTEMAAVDPSGYFRGFYGKDGPQNWSFWENDEFESFLDRIDREADPVERLKLIRDSELLMEQEVPLAPVAWETLNVGFANYVKGHSTAENIGLYDRGRMATMWLDK